MERKVSTDGEYSLLCIMVLSVPLPKRTLAVSSLSSDGTCEATTELLYATNGVIY